MRVSWVLALGWATLLIPSSPCRVRAQSPSAAHSIELHQRILEPDDGLLLGNGDLSVSVYQTSDRIVFRFGKGDVWDRRIDRSEDPRPAHIDEIARGIRDEGWKCPPYGGPVEALRGTKDPERMREICQAVPPSYARRPYPCPKPVGELALHLPPDQPGLRIRQRLAIEEARLSIHCEGREGFAIRVDAFVPPRTNVLVVRWAADGWTVRTRTGNDLPPVWLSLYRWPDPPIAEFAARFFAECRHPAFRTVASPKATPLTPPRVHAEQGFSAIVQDFPPDPTFPEGFQCLLAPIAPGCAVEPVDMGPTGEARIHILPPRESIGGLVAVAVATTTEGGPERLRTIVSEAEDLAASVKVWDQERERGAREFWSRSRVSVSDPLLEGLWYETIHARRCAYRAGCIPPGLFLPSTVRDYSHWHGDYHTNYNFQQPFWGDLASNHVELADSYLDGMRYLFDVGRKIARDYYGTRGMFVQLSGYPAVMQDDPLGCVPMGRMAYMTGWAVHQLWWRWLYTLDRDWLRTHGYPHIRDAALFYTDFLEKGDDGLWHIFPSNQGEDGFTGDPKDYTDRAQVLRHTRYCLRAAIGASEALDLDDDLRADWRERLDAMAGDDGRPPERLEGVAQECAERNPPEFGAGRPYRPGGATSTTPWPPEGDGAWSWYFGQYPWMVIQRLHAGDLSPEVDLPCFRRMVERWRRPNGILQGMSAASYGHAGAWTESLGVVAALQEMWLQSWDGALRIFPAWPRGLEASFEGLRAEGAFLVGASWAKGEVRSLSIRSEKGGRCRLYPPWKEGIRVVDSAGAVVPTEEEPYGRVAFETRASGTYRVERSVP